MSKYKNELLFIFVLILVTANQTLLAERAVSPNVTESSKLHKPKLRVFSIHDVNRDGSLSRDEYHHFVEQIENHRKATGRPMHRLSSLPDFDEVDFDGNGYINEDELILILNERLKTHRRYRHHR